MFRGFTRGRGGTSFSPPTGAGAQAQRPRLRVAVSGRGGTSTIFGIRAVNAGGARLLTAGITGRG